MGSENVKTPGQLAYEAYEAACAPPEERASWAVEHEWNREAWEAAAIAGAAPAHERAAELVSEGNSLREQLNAARDEIEQLKARLADSGAEHPTCDIHRWYAVVKHYGAFAYGFSATSDGMRMWDDVNEFEQAKAEDFA